jgi:DNA repair exonuclease SbcCD ATPase subunit
VKLQELLTKQSLASAPVSVELEEDADTFRIDHTPGQSPLSGVRILNADLESRAATVSRLSFDVESLRSRLSGLQSELRARQDISDDLNRRIVEVEGQLAENAAALRKRNKAIRDLKAEIRARVADAKDRADRNEQLLLERDRLDAELKVALAEIEQLKQVDHGDEHDPRRVAGQRSYATARSTELTAQLQRTEAYADQVRRQLGNKSEEVEKLEKSLRHVRLALREKTTLIEKLKSGLRSEGQANRALVKQISGMQQRHDEDVGQMQADLRAAEDALNRSMLLNEQLAADLHESRAYRERMEQMLNHGDSEHRKAIAGLERKVAELTTARANLEEQLAKRTEAVYTLLAEVKKHDSCGEAVELPPAPGSAAPKDRVNRLLVGRFDNEELRFPLFKGRLTIGRAQQNDIHLDLPVISRRHAVVVTEGNATRIVDWGSRNGVFVNSVRVTEHFLKSGDLIRVGNAVFRYEERSRRES